jgi:hypothetical protein
LLALGSRAENGGVPPSEDFHRDFLPMFIDAQRAFHTGDPEPNIALWATTEPVTLFAVRGKRKDGTADVTAAFREGCEAMSWPSRQCGGYG